MKSLIGHWISTYFIIDMGHGPYIYILDQPLQFLWSNAKTAKSVHFHVAFE